MLRSAASPGSVGFGRFGSGTSGLLMTPLPAGHLRSAAENAAERHRAPEWAPLLFCGAMPFAAQCVICGAMSFVARRARYLIFASRNSTCFLATGSYFFLVSLSVMVREFLRVT